ncbi:bacteriophage abortive infection AbiH family protein [Terrisporobacter mayombei]|uniref:Bacteriophage abortive infection AbiH n=1 Tax=Terrisporobacter mayombei TaxID=1541 RepID=A0ABY9Q267_9FIRM|nr:bacteriophage abortive infection AbiH family protein [Terrisporobacter mayombei]MCC3866900.1 bacteriophage abortive infection AbiH family protein [Terrisporobacter mayombei]WMT81145.1 hypothetical protein TEMA_14780 [Terrisporobacter mayombei]
MSKLFILGNGFDLNHNLKTKYEDFREYLLERYPGVDETPLYCIEGSMLPDGNLEYDEKEVAIFIFNLISQAEGYDNEWNDIEISLGKLDFGMLLEDMVEKQYDKDGDLDWSEMDFLYEIASSDFYKPTLKIKELLSDWIETIDVKNSKPNQKFKNLIDSKQDLFLNFNYTKTLEVVYKINNVFHIHGIQGADIVVGHNEEYDALEDEYTSAEGNFIKIHNALRKDTSEIINKSKVFFNNLSHITEIYSHGFSFSEVDLPYIQEICRRIDTTNLIWYLSSYDSEEEIKKYRDKIEKCGFKGIFKEFTI